MTEVPPGPTALPESNRAERSVPRLSRAQFWIVLAIAVAHFLVGHGPVWEDPTDYRRLFRSIGWSYLPIPLLVAALLAASRRLTGASFLLATLEVAAAKFALTATIVVSLWAGTGQGSPEARARAGPPRADHAPPRPPAPTPRDPRETGRVRGSVRGGGGQPSPGTLVWLSGNLGGHVFAAPSRPVVLEVGADGLEPPLSVLQAWQPLVTWSLDGRLHTVEARDARGRLAFNHPVLAPSVARARVVPEAAGLVRLRCRVHGEERTERAWMLVTDHPFWVRADGDGRFEMSGVPGGSLALTAWHPAEGRAEASAHLAGGATVDVVLTLGPAPSGRD